MMNEVHEHSVVALLDDFPTTHFRTKQPLLLERGQVGTVVMVYGEKHVEVEFSDTAGVTYALVTMSPDRLMVLRHSPNVVLQ